MSVDGLETLAGMVQYRRFPRGAFIVGQNEIGSSMYLLVSGRVKVSLASPEGKELVLNYLEAPAHFGEMALVDAQPRSADVIAVTDVELFGIDAQGPLGGDPAAAAPRPLAHRDAVAPAASHHQPTRGHGVPRRDSSSHASRAQRRDRRIRDAWHARTSRA